MWYRINNRKEFSLIILAAVQIGETKLVNSSKEVLNASAAKTEKIQRATMHHSVLESPKCHPAMVTDTAAIKWIRALGWVRISLLQAACAMASLARRETLTIPTLLPQPGRNPTGDRPREPLDISDANYAALLASLTEENSGSSSFVLLTFWFRFVCLR